MARIAAKISTWARFLSERTGSTYRSTAQSGKDRYVAQAGCVRGSSRLDGMRSRRFLGWAARAAAGAAALGGLVLAGCGMPGAPQPPSLNLPDRVTDLSAVRAGNQVSLTWTMPKRNTDKLLLQGDVQARVCRKES